MFVRELERRERVSGVARRGAGDGRAARRPRPADRPQQRRHTPGLRGRSSSGWPWNSDRRRRDAREPMRRVERVSVVAPIRVTRPDSTTGRSASCCALLKRSISSMKSTVRRPCAPRRSRSTADDRLHVGLAGRDRGQLLGVRTACRRRRCARASSCRCPAARRKRARTTTRSSSIARRSAAPSPTSCGWPANSSSPRGRRRSASGACAARRSSAASSNRLTAGL